MNVLAQVQEIKTRKVSSQPNKEITLVSRTRACNIGIMLSRIKLSPDGITVCWCEM